MALFLTAVGMRAAKRSGAQSIKDFRFDRQQSNELAMKNSADKIVQIGPGEDSLPLRNIDVDWAQFCINIPDR